MMDTKAQAHWDNVDIDVVRDVSWLGISELSQHYGREFEPTLDPRRVVDEFLVPLMADRPNGLRGMALVCGDMAAEHSFFQPRGPLFFGHVLGIDLSPESLARAEQYTAPFPFEGRCQDANDLELAPGSLDLAVGMHGIHHIKELENAFGQLAKALAPGGVLYMYEWIGPKYLQIPKRNAFVARLLLLGFSRRERLTHIGRRKGWFLQLRPKHFDPSEAVASPELEPQFLRFFTPDRVTRFGGLTYPMFEGNAPNIDMSNPGVAKRVRRVIAIERWLTDRNLIAPLFMTAVGRPTSQIMGRVEP
jgi:SAM-dependent methyltransferase